jgi:DNA modification methylase
MNDQPTLNLDLDTSLKGPVICLGMTFENDKSRREYFIERLKEKLHDPVFRNIEGFPMGTDDDIIALSDPPYYTACPNPWIQDFIREWEKEKGERANLPYQREPFASDVSEGKNDPIYNAHSYHTKVPHKAIMRYILHYTEPGDVIFDGFCGTGMTGVASYMCGDRNAVFSLGYQIKENGTILDNEGKAISKLGIRKAILNDLSPAATFIADNYNSPLDVIEYEKDAKRVLENFEDECGWMYETLHSDGKTIGKINYTVWSDVFICPNCTQEVVFWNAAVDIVAGIVKDEFPCPHCKSILSKRIMDRSFITKYDKSIASESDNHNDNGFEEHFDDESIESGTSIRQAKTVPVFIVYSIGKTKYKKVPSEYDLALIDKIEQMDIPYWFPTMIIPKGDKTSDPFNSGITHVHQFYTKRNLYGISRLWSLLPKRLLWIATSFLWRNLTKQNRFVINKYNPQGRINGPLTGTLYIPSEQVEQSIISLFKEKCLKSGWNNNGNILSTESTTNVSICAKDSIDYIFTDPPFGSNFMYSELNLILESWLRIITANNKEAIENNTQRKDLFKYQKLMRDCFVSYYSALKPGRWMTVEFHNSKNSVWNVIQEALQQAGFVVADVRTLDKVHGGVKAAFMANSVKQDLIISCYKPNGGLEERFIREANTEEGVWDFVRTHLKQLPRIVIEKNKLQVVLERQNYLLYDRMVAFYVQRSVMVPLSSGEFYKGLEQRFPVRDGMYFLPDQVVEYDKKRMSISDVAQIQIFVIDEASAIQWLKQLLTDKPQTFQEIHPQFIRELGGWSKAEKPLELSLLLDQNFLSYEGKGDVPNQIHSYLSTNWKDFRNLSKDDSALRAKAKDRWYVPDFNKIADMEQMREKYLLKEFWTYLPDNYKPKKSEEVQFEIPGLNVPNLNIPKGKRYKVIRLEAVRAGFKFCWQNRDYQTIITVAERIPSNVLDEDPKLLMFYDQAITRTDGN